MLTLLSSAVCLQLNFSKVMLLPILEDRRSHSGDAVIKSISTRIAGGRKELNTEPSKASSIFHIYLFCCLINVEQ